MTGRCYIRTMFFANHHRAVTRSTRTLLLAALLGAGGCSGDVGALRGTGIVGSAPKGPDAPDFVASSRKADQDYMPVGVSAPKRTVRAKSTEGQKALEAELENARSRNVSRGKAAESAGKTVNPSPAPAPASAPTP